MTAIEIELQGWGSFDVVPSSTPMNIWWLAGA